MLKQRVVIGALAVMLALSVSASAVSLVVDGTTVAWTETTGIDDVSIINGGVLNSSGRVNMKDNSILTLDGGTFTNTNSAQGGFKFPDDDGPSYIYLTEGTFTANRMETKIAVPVNLMVIKDGLLKLETQPSENYTVKRLLELGRLEAADGYELVFEDWSGNPVDPMTQTTGSIQVYAIPAGPVNPVPADGSTVSDLNLSQLCWDNYVFTSAKVYFGAADANELDYLSKLTLLGTTGTLATDGTQACFSLSGSLTSETLYSWAVERADGDPNVVVFQFYATAAPDVVSSPVNQSVLPDGTAVFTAVFNSTSNLTAAQWSKDGSPVGTAVINALPNDQYEVTLTITDAAVADEGAYTCVATNSGGSSSPTAAGYLTVKRTLAYWTFDNTLADTTGVYTPTSSTLTPSYVAGVPPISGTRTALDFADFGSDNLGQVLTIPNGFASFRAGITVSTWLNMDSASDTSAFILQLGAGGTGDTILLRRVTAGGDLRVGTGGGTEVLINDGIPSGQWHHIAATVSDAGAFKVFINGVNVHNGSGNTPYAVTRTKNLIGADSATGRNDQFIGQIDEIKIRNYAISDSEVLDEYHGVVGGFTCLEDLAYDLTGDCRVGLADLALLVNDWLECGRIPASECFN